MGRRILLFANAHCKDVEDVLFVSRIEVQCVRGKHVQRVGWRRGVYKPGECLPLKALYSSILKILKSNTPSVVNKPREGPENHVTKFTR